MLTEGDLVLLLTDAEYNTRGQLYPAEEAFSELLTGTEAVKKKVHGECRIVDLTIELMLH